MTNRTPRGERGLVMLSLLSMILVLTVLAALAALRGQRAVRGAALDRDLPALHVTIRGPLLDEHRSPLPVSCTLRPPRQPRRASVPG